MSQYTWRIDFKIGYPESNENYFYVTFRQSREYLQMAEKETKIIPMKVPIKVTERVTEKQIMILKEIIKDKFVTAKHLSAVVGISERKIKENIKKLKNKEVLKELDRIKVVTGRLLANERFIYCWLLNVTRMKINNKRSNKGV